MPFDGLKKFFGFDEKSRTVTPEGLNDNPEGLDNKEGGAGGGVPEKDKSEENDSNPVEDTENVDQVAGTQGETPKVEQPTPAIKEDNIEAIKEVKEEIEKMENTDEDPKSEENE